MDKTIISGYLIILTMPFKAEPLFEQALGLTAGLLPVDTGSKKRKGLLFTSLRLSTVHYPS